MRAKHAGDLLHGLDAAAHGPLAPIIQKATSPVHRPIGPEVLECFLPIPRPSGGQAARQQAFQFGPGATANATATAQQLPAHFLEALGQRATSQAAGLFATHLIDGLVEVHDDVEAVHHMQRQAGHLGHDGEIGLPHVAANEAQSGDDFGAQSIELPAQRGFGPSRSHPQQSMSAGVDLVDDDEKVRRPAALSPVDLVDADGVNVTQLPMLPLDEPFDRTAHGLPTDVEEPGGFAPGQASGQSRQERHHRGRHRALAVAPGEVLDHHPVLVALGATRSIKDKHRDRPERDKALPAFRQAVVARAGLARGRAAGANSGLGFNTDLDVLLALLAGEANLAVHETREGLNPIENGLSVELDGWPPWLDFGNGLQTQSADRKPAISFNFFRGPKCRMNRARGSEASLESSVRPEDPTHHHPPARRPSLEDLRPPEIPHRGATGPNHLHRAARWSRHARGATACRMPAAPATVRARRWSDLRLYHQILVQSPKFLNSDASCRINHLGSRSNEP